MRFTIIHRSDLTGGQWLEITPACSDVLRTLSMPKHRFNNHPNRGCEITTGLQPLVSSQTRQAVLHSVCERSPAEKAFLARLGLECMEARSEAALDNLDAHCSTCLPGLLPVIAKLLRDSGAEVVISGRETRQFIHSIPTSPNCGPVRDPHVMEFVGRTDRGLLRVGRTVSPAFLIAQIATATPHGTLAIATSRQEEASNIGRALRRMGVDAVNVTTQDDRNEQPRVVVGTYPAIMSSWSVGLANRDVLIVLSAVESLGHVGQQMLGRAWRGRFIGLIPLDRQLAPRDADQLRAFYGFDELCVPAHGFERLPIDVMNFSFRSERNTALDVGITELLRLEIWHHAMRNRVIARLAKQIQLGEHFGRATFPAVTAAMTDATPKRVAVLVENIEHAVRFAAELPDWHLITGTDVETWGLRDWERAILERCIGPKQAEPQVICTFDGLRQMDVTNFDVLLRADAGRHLPPLESQIHVGANRRLLLIDVSDRHHPQLGKWARQRRKAYVRQGWYAPEADPGDERVKKFLADCRGR